MSMWYEFGTWLNRRYPPADMFFPVVPYIPSMDFMFWFLLVVARTFSPCLSNMSYLIPKEDNKAVVFFLVHIH